MPSLVDIPIGERVRFYRQARHKTQAVVAGLAGVTEDYLSQIERGLKTPSTALLHRLARVLGAPTSVLFGESSAEPAAPGHPLSAAIHTALAAGGDGASADDPPDLLVLRDRVEAAWKSWQGSSRRYSQTGPLLPSLTRPAAVLLLAVLHFLADTDDPAGVVAALARRLAPGSFVVISHLTGDFAPGPVTAGVEAYNALVPGPLVPRSHAQVSALFGGLPLVPPGVVPVTEWRPAIVSPLPHAADLYAGVARAPGGPVVTAPAAVARYVSARRAPAPFSEQRATVKEIRCARQHLPWWARVLQRAPTLAGPSTSAGSGPTCGGCSTGARSPTT